MNMMTLMKRKMQKEKKVIINKHTHNKQNKNTFAFASALSNVRGNVNQGERRRLFTYPLNWTILLLLIIKQNVMCHHLALLMKKNAKLKQAFCHHESNHEKE